MLGLQSRVLMYQVCVVLKTALPVISQGGFGCVRIRSSSRMSLLWDSNKPEQNSSFTS